MSQHDYINDYLENLSAELRPEINDRLKEALRTAWRNRWDAKLLALLIDRGDYAGTHAPAGAALYRLEKLAATKPNTTGEITQSFTDNHCRKSGCACSHNACYRGWIDGGETTKLVGKMYREYETTSPCPVCRYDQYEILRSTHDSQEASAKLQERSVYNQQRKQSF